jgi:hypothetical protein
VITSWHFSTLTVLEDATMLPMYSTTSTLSFSVKLAIGAISSGASPGAAPP